MQPVRLTYICDVRTELLTLWCVMLPNFSSQPLELDSAIETLASRQNVSFKRKKLGEQLMAVAGFSGEKSTLN